MKWKGKELKTMGEIGNVIDNIFTKEEAQEFMEIYRSENKHADDNIGFLSGYYPPEDAKRIKVLFGVEHPIFDKMAIKYSREDLL